MALFEGDSIFGGADDLGPAGCPPMLSPEADLRMTWWPDQAAEFERPAPERLIVHTLVRRHCDDRLPWSVFGIIHSWIFGICIVIVECLITFLVEQRCVTAVTFSIFINTIWETLFEHIMCWWSCWVLTKSYGWNKLWARGHQNGARLDRTTWQSAVQRVNTGLKDKFQRVTLVFMVPYRISWYIEAC